MAGRVEPLLDDGRERERKRDRIKGIGLTCVVSFLMTSEAAATSFATTSAVPQYTVNFTHCLAGLLTAWLVAVCTGAQLAVDRPVFILCMEFGVAMWFFLWGYVKALLFMEVVDVTALNVGFSPIASTALGAFMLGETFTSYKAFVLLRNVAVVVIILGFPKGADSATILQGYLWGAVMCIGMAFMRTVQRKIATTPAVTTTFYGLAFNTITWFPPGGMQWRIPFLWPAEPQDGNPEDDLPFPVWLCMALGGVFAGLLVALQGVVLVLLDVGTYSMWVSPVFLVLSTIWQGFVTPLPSRVFAGIAFQIVGSVLDFVVERRAKRDDP
jgi:hypothetical protein